MKIQDILKTASGNMLQSKVRTFLTITAIFIGALTLTLTTAMGAGISDYINRQVANVGAKDLLILQPQTDGNFTALNDSAPKKYDPDRVVSDSGFGVAVPVLTSKDIEELKGFSELSDVRPVYSPVADYIQGSNGEKYQITLDNYWTGTNLDMGSGTEPDNAVKAGQISLPSKYVSVLGFASYEDAVGKEVKIGVKNALGQMQEVSATVSGVQLKSLVGAGGANINQFLNESLYAERVEGLPGAQKDQYAFAVARFDTSISDQALTDLKKKLNDAGFRAMTVEDQIGILKQVISGVTIVFNLFGIIALLCAAFGVINTLFMAVQERTREIGLMKAIGLSGGKIFFLFSTEAVLLGFWGSLLGVLGAYGIGQIANNVASTGFLKDFEGLELLVFPLQSVAGIMLIIMFIAFLAGTLPARRAAKLNPIDALRYE
jgi:putative ABC transport system permease protein